MHARVTTYQNPPEQLTDEAVDKMRTDILPRVFEVDGNRGAIFLMDRQTGKTMSITLWENEDALRASEQKANQLRGDAVKQTGGEIGAVERFEVQVLEVRDSTGG